ncbi:MAG: hypothetical protein REI96_22625 [Flavobacterium nitrogenifigens]|uniref:hypothetical protein n=1 Tax=Flavobacterium nitrogenifigens TaxID=1617283 RepID=UPI0028090FCA|nr:hypothetical protein [Flavobacterium nitrogenifigens]MDQ8015259.1 hypothetical protein [Flavobacterium nitrogenifigens]
MALEKILEVYLTRGETSDVIVKLKEMNVCLESFFNRVQQIKAYHNSKVYFQDIHKAGGSAAFDSEGNLKNDFQGPQVKMIYTYFDTDGKEQTAFILI